MPNLKLFFVVISVMISFYYSSPVFSHVPHDVVEAITLSPNFNTDNTVYSLIRSNILKSTNRGLTWKRLVLGLDNTSPIVSLAIDPVLPNILYLSTASNGIYKSENAGQSWRKVNQGLDTLNINKLYLPPVAIHLPAFATGKQHALYKTANGGISWTKVYDDPIPLSAISGFNWNASIGREVLIGDNNGRLFLSTDTGLTWNKIYDFPNCGAITSLATSQNPLLRQTFFLGTKLCGVFRTEDGGKSFNKVNAGIADLNIRSLAMSPNFKEDATVFASTGSQAIFVSSNSGLSWQKQQTGITTDIQGGTERNFGDISISADFKKDKTLFLAGFDGLFKSVDGGRQWKEMNTMPLSLIQSVALSPSYTTDNNLALTTYSAGMYQSANQGTDWNKIASSIAGRNSDIVFSPSYTLDGTMFVSISSLEAIGKSTDYGKSWTLHKTPTKMGWPTILAISPTYKQDKTIFAALRSTHVIKSTDGGNTFKSVFYDNGSPSFCPYCVSALLISPDYSNDHTLLVATLRNGIYISRNGGISWSNKGLKTSFGQFAKLAISPNYAQDHTLFIGSTTGLFRTEDGFQSWTKISNTRKGIDGYIEELAVSPNFKNDHTLLIAVRGKGLFKSVDGGNTFRAIGASLINHNYSFSLWDAFPVATTSLIRFSPNYAMDKTIYGTSSDRVFRSKDGGETWSNVLLHWKLNSSPSL